MDDNKKRNKKIGNRESIEVAAERLAEILIKQIEIKNEVENSGLKRS